MKVGILAPQFLTSPNAALTTADEAERLGVDGVFVFDHLWSLDKPQWTPSQSAIPLLSALAARSNTLTVGTLVARVGIEPNDLLYNQIMTVAEIADGRFIAGLGIGDKLSIRENKAYGVEFPPRAERLEVLRDLARRLKASGVTVWLGGRSAEIRAVAVEIGVLVNQWSADVRDLKATDTWGGVFSDEASVKALEQRGVEWSVFLVPGSAADPKRAVQQLSDACEH